MTPVPQYFIDGKPYKLGNSSERVSRLLQLAGTSSEDTILVSKGGVEHNDPDELMEISPDDHFTTRKRGSQKPLEKPIHYTVNGEENSTLENPLSLEVILQNAGAGAAIDINNLVHYYLENIEDGRKYENLDDLVLVSDGDKFPAIHAGATPIA